MVGLTVPEYPSTPPPPRVRPAPKTVTGHPFSAFLAARICSHLVAVPRYLRVGGINMGAIKNYQKAFHFIFLSGPLVCIKFCF